MPCAEIHEKVALAAYAELPDAEMHQLAVHLAGCAGCRAEQEQVLALKTLAAAYPVPELDANLLARSRTRLEEALDALPPKRWYDRLAAWMTRTAAGLQAAPAAACLLLVAGTGIGSLVGFEFAQRHAAAVSSMAQPPAGDRSPAPVASVAVLPREVAGISSLSSISSISSVARRPDSNLIEVTFSQVEPRRVSGTLQDPEIRQLLMLASQNGSSPAVRDDSVGLLAAECRSGHGCESHGGAGSSGAGDDVRDVLMIALRYDRSAAVRRKALDGLQPYVGEDMRVRNAILQTLLNDPDAHVRSAAIGMLQPVEADTSVRQVLSTVALSDQNSDIRNASRVVLRRVSELQ